MAIYRVPPHLVGDIWGTIERFVRDACEYHPFLDASDVRLLVERGVCALFIATDDKGVMGFGAVEVVEYPRRTVANILGVGGRRGFLNVVVHELAEAMIDFGATQGATIVALSGRPGWLRALRGRNARSRRYVTMWAEINGERRRINQDDDYSVETSGTVPS